MSIERNAAEHSCMFMGLFVAAKPTEEEVEACTRMANLVC
jgi:hypothetical protein